MCRDYGIDPEVETNEVETSKDGMASFMEQGVNDGNVWLDVSNDN